MNTISNFSQITKHLAGIESNLAALADCYANISARSSIDDALIDTLIAKSQELEVTAAALKKISFGG